MSQQTGGKSPQGSNNKQWWDTQDGKKHLSKKLFEEASKDINSWGNLSTSQLRKYYGEIKSLENRLINLSEGKKDKMQEIWKDIHPMFIMVKAKISYDKARKDAGVTDGFKTYMENCINSVKDHEDFGAFTKYFEACVGYFYWEQAKKEEEKKREQQQKQYR